MPRCCISHCSNRSNNNTILKGGVSYHRFPKDPDVKEVWITATGRSNWMPTASSTICSEHFTEKDFMITPKGYRYLNKTAIPSKKILLYYEQHKLTQIPGPSKRGSTSYSTDTKSTVPNKKARLHEEQNFVLTASRPTRVAADSEYLHEIPKQTYSQFTTSRPKSKTTTQDDESSSSVYSTPRKQKFRRQLRWAEDKIKSQKSKIMRLLSRNRRLNKKVKSLQEVLNTLENKFAMSKENLDCLKNTNLGIQELVARNISNTESGVISRRKYSAALRSFALTLHYYSPRAYDYVRQKFNASLPHPRTLKNWYCKVGGEPGFTKESFEALKLKAEASSQPLLATLVLDEMSIRRRIEWDGHKFHGYVDIGTGLEGDHLAEAKEALVFLVTLINSSFKVPVAYFLTDGVSGQQRADLVKQCLELINDAGIKIVALTFDGCAANMSMAQHLGCSFEEHNICFEHPVTKDPIVVVLDPCHMIKLLRNAFENFKTFIDIEGKQIKWQHLVELNKLQNDETFHLSNKLSDRHIHFQNERMKVKLATQLFSLSVAEGIKFCRQSGIPAFCDSEPTEKFLVICNNLFDIFNSRNLHSYGFKKALNSSNAGQVFQYLNEASHYIRNLRLENGTLLVKSSRKTGFLGFLGCAEALKHLCCSLIKTNKLIYLPFYKLSQDHLELLFCNIRAHGGSNNNPTARQFVSAYKKILIHVELRDTNKGNVTALEQISILNCSSAVERINKSVSTDESYNEKTDNEELELEEIGNHFSEFSNQAIGHIAGYIVRALLKKIYCDVCVGALVTRHFETFHKFIIAKDKGGLLYPSPDVVRICQTAELYLKILDFNFNSKNVVMAKIMRQFIGTNIFDDIASHQLGEFPSSNHVTDLIKAVLEKYINIRLHHLLKLKLRLSRRQFLNKYVLFQGQ